MVATQIRIKIRKYESITFANHKLTGISEYFSDFYRNLTWGAEDLTHVSISFLKPGKNAY